MPGVCGGVISNAFANTSAQQLNSTSTAWQEIADGERRPDRRWIGVQVDVLLPVHPPRPLRQQQRPVLLRIMDNVLRGTVHVDLRHVYILLRYLLH